MKSWKIIVLLCLIGSQIMAADSFYDNSRGWISLSSLWGQGGMGVSYKTTNLTYCLSDFYSYDWSEDEFAYNEVEFLIKGKEYFYGTKLRYQNGDDEVAPFIGRHDYFGKKQNMVIPFSIHNEIEWRESPYSVDSYLRSQHGLTVFSPKSFFDKNALTPFASIVTYYDWGDSEFEKTRVYVGYSMRVDKYKFSIYYIPWRDGRLEQEWDDQRDFGATIQYSF